MNTRIIAHPHPAHRRGSPWRRAARAWRGLLARVGSDCPACGGAARGGLLCPPCAGDARGSLTHGAPRCPRCALPVGPGRGGCAACLAHPPAFARTVAAFDYAPPFDTLVVRFKNGGLALASALGGLLHEAARDAGMQDRDPPVDLLVPVPASRASLRRRGFNPAAEIAMDLAARLELPCRRGVLRRQREDAGRQASRARHERISAARGLYACALPLSGLRVGLVDDVMTTGSTADACAQALLDADAASVTVLVAARTLQPRF